VKRWKYLEAPRRKIGPKKICTHYRCIRISFVGNYRVIRDPGLHFPVRLERSGAAFAFWGAHREVQ
jgi:hypothetical protein